MTTENLNKAYEDLEKEINEIKSKLQTSMASGGSLTASQLPPASNTVSAQKASGKRYQSIGSSGSKPRRMHQRTPAQDDDDDDDYSLSASEMANSMMNSGNGEMAPKF